MKSTVGYFGGLFLVFFLLWHPTLKQGFDYLDDGCYGLYYRETFYHPGFFLPFDFRYSSLALTMDTYYAPIPTIVFNGLSALFGQWPIPFYLFGFLLHCLNAVLVYSLAVLLTKRRFIGMLSAAIFLLYPANRLTTSWVAAIVVHPVTAFFYLNSLIYWIKFLRTRSHLAYSVSLFSFLCACFSRFFAITLIPIMVMLELLCCRDEMQDSRKSRFERFLRWMDWHAPFMLIALAFLGIAFLKYPMGGIAQKWGGTTLSGFTIFRFIEFVTWLTFPFFTSVGRPVYIVASAAFLISLVFTIGGRFEKFLMIWIFLSLGFFTISNFREIDTLYRYLYIATIPFSMLVSCAVLHGIEKLKTPKLRHVS